MFSLSSLIRLVVNSLLPLLSYKLLVIVSLPIFLVALVGNKGIIALKKAFIKTSVVLQIASMMHNRQSDLVVCKERMICKPSYTLYSAYKTP